MPATLEIEKETAEMLSAQAEARGISVEAYLRSLLKDKATLAETSLLSFDFDTVTEDLGGVTLEIIKVPAGVFMMGSPDSEEPWPSDKRPPHLVSVSSFYMGKYEVTQFQWRAVSVLPKVKYSKRIGVSL